jgi:hypothetical protein
MDAPGEPGLINISIVRISLYAPLMGHGIVARLVYDRAALLVEDMLYRFSRLDASTQPAGDKSTGYCSLLTVH